MDTLKDIDDFIKPETKEFCFSNGWSSTRNKYLYGKSIFTYHRVVQSVRELLKRSNGSKCYASTQRVIAITGFSESTVRRYLKKAIDYLDEIGEVVLTIDEAKGYLICSPEWLEMTEKNGDLFEAKRCLRSPWITKSQRSKIVAFKRPPPPLSKIVFPIRGEINLNLTKLSCLQR